jgi:hypothetical protein
MPGGNRMRFIDSWTFGYLNTHDATSQAADELISHPEKHLLTQE